MPHLQSALQTARWLTKSTDDAEDVVQEAALRAFRFMDGLQSNSAKAWFLTIVRRVAFDFRQKSRRFVFSDDTFGAGEEIHADDPTFQPPPQSAEEGLIASAKLRDVRLAVSRLPESLRIILLLREVESLTYEQISQVENIPIGTVMSRLSRARRQLKDILMSTGGVN